MIPPSKCCYKSRRKTYKRELKKEIFPFPRTVLKKDSWNLVLSNLINAINLFVPHLGSKKKTKITKQRTFSKLQKSKLIN